MVICRFLNVFVHKDALQYRKMIPIRYMFRRLCTAATEEVKKPKEKIRTRLANYIKMVYGDYKTVAKETGEDMKEHPVKTGIYLSILGVTGYLWKTNPSERSFRTEVLEHMNELLLVGDPIRNPHADNHIQKLMWCYNNGQIRRMNLGVCSIMWQDNFPEEVDLFEAQCKPIMVGWLQFKDRILDIGIAGRWLWLNEAMIDYDINPNEWPNETEKS